VGRASAPTKGWGQGWCNTQADPANACMQGHTGQLSVVHTQACSPVAAAVQPTAHRHASKSKNEGATRTSRADAAAAAREGLAAGHPPYDQDPLVQFAGPVAQRVLPLELRPARGGTVGAQGGRGGGSRAAGSQAVSRSMCQSLASIQLCISHASGTHVLCVCVCGGGGRGRKRGGSGCLHASTAELPSLGMTAASPMQPPLHPLRQAPCSQCNCT
jgi:hypothetical protein